MMTDRKGSDLELSLGQLAPRFQSGAVVPRAPDLPRRIVAVNVNPIEFRQWLAIIDFAAGQRAHLGMGMFDGRLNDRSGAEFAVEIKRVAAFINTPSVILAATDQVSG